MELVKDKLTTIDLVDDSMYNVVMYNDDITPIEYVVTILKIGFQYSFEDAMSKAFEINGSQKGIVATTSLTKAHKLMDYVDAMNAQANQFLRVDVEQA